MKRAKMFSLTAGLVLAATFTLSCSSDDPDDNNPDTGGGTPSDNNPGAGGGIPDELLNLPVSFDGIENGAKIDLFLTFPNYKDYSCGGYDDYECECTGYDGVVSQCEWEDIAYDSIPAGKIENGQLTLELPTQAEISKYLSVLKAPYYYVNKSTLRPAIPGKSDCYIYARLVNSDKGDKTDISFWYLSDAVRPSSSEREDLNFSKGWNVVYTYVDSYYDHDNDRDVIRDYMRTTDPSKVGGGTLEWRLEECRDE